jgi:hypothetical protein
LTGPVVIGVLPNDSVGGVPVVAVDGVVGGDGAAVIVGGDGAAVVVGGYGTGGCGTGIAVVLSLFGGGGLILVILIFVSPPLTTVLIIFTV